MGPYIWRILGGFMRVMMLYVPAYIAWFVISHFDNFWNALLWRPLFGRDFLLVGFLASLLVFYFIGTVSETRYGMWLDKNLFTKIPVIGHLFVSFNPQVRELFKKARGAVIARYQSGWRVAFLTVVHKTREGYLGSVGYVGLPPIPQQLDQDSPIKVLSVGDGRGETRFALIPREIAIRQELSFGTTVPPDAYRDVVEITFGELVPSLHLSENGEIV